jgi:hypothetical protein
MAKSQIATPTGDPITVEDVVSELSDRLNGISIINRDDEPVYTVGVAPIHGANIIEIVMSDESKFIIEIKPKN